MQVDEALLDTIYETVLHPELWDDVLRRMAEGVRAEGGALVWQDIFTNATGGIFSRTDPEAIDLFSGYFATRNPLRPPAAEVARKVRGWKPRIVLDEDRMAKEAFVKTEFYNDFFRRFDFHSSAAIGLQVDGRNGGTLDLMKSQRTGEFSTADLDFIREAQPHLSRAFKAGRQVASVTGGLGSPVANAFDHWPFGVLILSANRRVLYSNAAAEAFARAGSAIRIVQGVLSAVDADAASRLDALVRTAADQDEARRSGGSLAAPASPDHLPLALSITPLRTERHPLFSQPAVLVTLADPAGELVLSPEKLREVFGLTATEVKVAMALFGGQPTGDVADQLGISVNTVRNHLAHILEKTHSSGQAELSRRLMALA